MIERIYIGAPSGDSQQEVPAVQVIAGAGIVGDRYFGRHDEPGQNITFVEAEAIESFQDLHARPRDLSVTRRNVVTRGVRLNELVGKEFIAGGLRFRGVELCEPCLGLGQALSSAALAPPAVVKAFVHRAGLRADALSSGELRQGAQLECEASGQARA
ncbi:sulfurase [Aquincola sp. S2]|uniref:Sulfurase n=1 Tax=Pseudaquabacterium terrae TaxID=2732868 RepID=A0ABX2E9R2_9BURK|nr:sulfurase [Aquabacterium terrae]